MTIDSETKSTTELRGVPWLGFLPHLLVAGAVLGLFAVFLQVRFLRWGVIASGQWLPLIATFVLLGIAVSLAGGAAVRLLRRGGAGSRAVPIGVGVALTLLFFLVFVPWNVRGLPHVYLLVTDTTRRDHLSLYGYERETTPFLTKMAGEAVFFRNMVSQGSHTIVSTPCILASCYPSEHGITGYSQVLSPHFTLLSEYLRERGYKTYGYATNPHLGPQSGYSQGFDTYEYDPGWAQTPASFVNGRFLQWIDGEEGRPVFGFLFYIDMHNPYNCPPEFQRLFDPEWLGEPVTDWYQGPNNKPDPPTLRNIIAQYDGAIAFWDAELGKLVAGLDERGLWENSIFLYTSDHGEEFWEHGYWGHNRSLYEESIGVPLVISLPPPVKLPKMKRASGVVGDVASSVDIVPTVLEYLRIMPDPNVRGRSLASLVLGTGDPGPERRAYCEEILNRYGPYDLRGLRSERYKYVMTFQYEGARDLDDQFFDLEADPAEMRNAIRDLTDEAEDHRQMLAALVKEISGYAPARVDTIVIDEATRERLRALGYLE
ncbi:MAG: sulfatase-like hydrolase/transferase [Candidatus Eisenbacteria bacterium]